MSKIKYTGIKTNNLKHIDISIKQNSIQLLQGPSGSGKSSLAIDTIHKISEDELFQLLNVKEDISNYTLDNYSNILPSICLKQENFNRNPRSTIATYFNLDIFFVELFSKENIVSSQTFSFNINEFSCERCNGLGIELVVDKLKVIDYYQPLKNCPFRPWKNSTKDYFKQLLEIVANEKNINTHSKYSDLSLYFQKYLEYGISDKKYKIKYKTQNCNHIKTAKYTGIIKSLDDELKSNSKVNTNYYSYQTCECCKGGRFNSSVLKYKFLNKTIAELYLMEIENLLEWLQKNKTKVIKRKINLKTFSNICNFLEQMIYLKLPYLHLNRSIPSLSGGELQRLRLVKAITSHFFNFLYILDEPTAGLHPSEWSLITSIIKELKNKQNTVLLIEHNEEIEKIADSIIYLGPSGGCGGGNIIKNKVRNLNSIMNYNFFQSKEKISIKKGYSNNINNLSFELPLGTLVGICGVSGSGKSSLIKNILPKFLNNSIYLNQSPINGNAYSIIATSLGIMTYIQDLFSKNCKKQKEYFTFSSKGKGQCELCKGKGVIPELATNANYEVICPDCNGKRFSSKSMKVKYKGYNIYEYLNLDIKTILEITDNPKITKILYLATNIGLDYLNLFQNTNTLSGGESQRIKFLNTIFKSKTKKILLLDEPFRGIDNINIEKMIKYLYNFIKKNYTIIIAEHNPEVLKHVSYIIELGPSGGSKGGKIVFNGKLSDIKDCKQSIMKNYLE